MRILVVGSGAREHALAWKFARSPEDCEILVTPGNAGTRLAGWRHLGVAAEDIKGVVAAATAEECDLVVVGPEAPLAAGLVDALEARGITAFGPTQAAARIESSKAWAKDFLQRHGVPTAKGRSFREIDEALVYIRKADAPQVVKASGLAAGKGVIVCATPEEAEQAVRLMMQERRFGAAADEIVIEERLQGPECSLMALTDGTHVLPLAPARDYKRALRGDRGPNTGGMGAYSPLPDLSAAEVERIVHRIIEPTVEGLAKAGHPFRGLLYAGVILTEQGPKLIEFNARFGDPETQVVLPRLESDLLPLCLLAARGDLKGVHLSWRPETAVGVVMAASGYPEQPLLDMPIEGLREAADDPEVEVFHAGTRLDGDTVRVSGGRVLTVVGLGANAEEARSRVYRRCRTIRFEGVHYRTDIAASNGNEVPVR